MVLQKIQWLKSLEMWQLWQDFVLFKWLINLNKHSAILNYYNWVVISVTRCYNKKCPNISSFCLKMMFFHKSPRSNQIFGLLLKENWQLKAFKNRPIWSHRQCLIFLNKIIDGHLQKSKFANLKSPSTPMIRVWIPLQNCCLLFGQLWRKNWATFSSNIWSYCIGLMSLDFAM